MAAEAQPSCRNADSAAAPASNNDDALTFTECLTPSPSVTETMQRTTGMLGRYHIRLLIASPLRGDHSG